MALILNTEEPAIARGIKTVGVGKKGSKPLTPELAHEILKDLKSGRVSAAAKGAFFAGLLAKGVEGDETILIDYLCQNSKKMDSRLKHSGMTEEIVNAIDPDAPEFVQWICVSLLNGNTLDKDTAYDLGRFLFSEEPGDGARGLVASFLRVRYETDDEYEGIWRAMQETMSPAFQGPTPAGEPIVQLAEPFDGNDHSYLITPIVADYIQQLGYRCVHMVGRNSGPKLIFNLLDVTKDLEVTFASGNNSLADIKPRFGWFLSQRDVSAAIDRWVDIRHQTIKRPFLATLEKFIKPLDARIIVTSAFHPPYGLKMVTISERAGFSGVMVIRNGIEGSMAFPLLRPAKILLSARQEDGSYLRHEIEFDVQAFLGQAVSTEERREQLSSAENACLIKAYAEKGSSGDECFDLRVKATCEGFKQGLEWLKGHGHGLG